MLILSLVLTAVISYLLGSCNSSIIVVKLLKHEDIREHGSKNAGLTNTLRCYGKVPAVLTLLGDLCKGIVAVFLSQFIVRMMAGENAIDLQYVGYIAGIFAIIGHVFPVYYGFKGGKGALVASSVLIVIDPITFGIVIPIFLIISLTTRYVSLGSMIAAASYPIVTFCINCFVRHHETSHCVIYTVFALITALLVIYMHRSNIKRLMNGTENKLGQKKPDEPKGE